MKTFLLPALLLCIFANALAAPLRSAPKPNPADLGKFSPSQQYQYAHLLLQADNRARDEAGYDPEADEDTHPDYRLYHRLKEQYQGALEHQYRITRAQGLALLREAYLKRWNIS